MKFARTGVILCTENYRQCVAFYTGVLGLHVMFSLDNEHSRLTCCDMGNENYLMIEQGGTAVAGRKTYAQNPVWLRFNVDDVDEVAAELAQKDVAVDLRREPWGTVADFVDPDGNVCSLRDEATFGR